MKDFNPKGFEKVGEINGMPTHRRVVPAESVIITNKERPFQIFSRQSRVNPNLLNLETPEAGPLERPSFLNPVSETSQTGGHQ
jgi:hypothetical protein